jgi:hypothetical protein
VSIQFGEVRKGSGLDLDTKPFPSMILPLAGSKIIKVFGASGFSLFDDRNILEIKPLDSSVVVMDKVVLSGLAGMGSPFDASSIQLKMAVEVGLQLAGNPQFFNLRGKALGGQVGTTVRVAKSQKSKAEGSLRVVILKPRTLKLSIRPVQVLNDKGSLINHCERDCEPNVLLRRINAVWTSQANIVFEPASFDPAPLDDQAAIAKALGSSSPKPIVPPIIEFDDFLGMFQKLKEKEKAKADFTIFMVHVLPTEVAPFLELPTRKADSLWSRMAAALRTHIQCLMRSDTILVPWEKAAYMGTTTRRKTC